MKQRGEGYFQISLMNVFRNAARERDAGKTAEGMTEDGRILSVQSSLERREGASQATLREHLALDLANLMASRVLPVLIEKRGRRPGRAGGLSPYLQAVHMQGPEGLIGQIVPVEIVSAGNNSLAGKIVTVAEPNSASGLESRAMAARPEEPQQGATEI